MSYMTYRSTPRAVFMAGFLAGPQGGTPAVEGAADDRDAVGALEKQPVGGGIVAGRSHEGAGDGDGDRSISAWALKLQIFNEESAFWNVDGGGFWRGASFVPCFGYGGGGVGSSIGFRS